MPLHHHKPEEEPLMNEVIQGANKMLVDAMRKGLSLSGGLNAMSQVVTMILVMAYKDQATREQVASAFPDMIKAYTPRWEKVIAQQNHKRF